MADKELIARLKADVSNFSAGMTKALADLEKLDATGKKIGKNSAGWFSEFGQSIKGEFMQGMLAANVAMKATQIAVEAFHEALADEKVFAKLDANLKKFGAGADEIKKKIEGVSGAFFELGKDDAMTKSLANLAINMGATGSNIESVIKNAYGLSEAFGISAEQGLKVFMKAQEGNITAAKKLIPELNDLSDAAALEEIFNKSANGIEQMNAAMDTAGGRLEVTTNRIKENLKEGASWIITALDDSFAFLGKTAAKGFGADRSGSVMPWDIQDRYLKNQMAPDFWDFSKSYPGSKADKSGFKYGSGGKNYTDEVNALNNLMRKEVWKGWNADEKPMKSGKALAELLNFSGASGAGSMASFGASAMAGLAKQWKELNSLDTGNISKFKVEFTDVLNKVEEAPKGMDAYSQSLIDENNKQKEANKTWQETQATLAIVAGAFDQLKNLLGTLGIELDNTAQGALDVGQGVAEFALNIKNPIAAAGAAIKVLGGIIKMFAGDGIGEAIKREDAWMKLTKEQTEALRKLSEQVGDTHAATSEMLNTIIDDAYINSQGKLDQYARRIREILSDVDNGKMTSAKAAKEIGDSFSSLLKKWENLKLPGITGDMLKLIQDTRGRGIKVQEIADFISAQLQAGVGAAAIYAQGIDSQAKFNRGIAYTMALFTSLQKEGMNLVEAMDALGPTFDAMLKKQSEAGFSSTKGFSELLGIRQFTNDNKDLMDGINATAKLLESLGNSAYLTSELFASFQSDAISDFDKLMKKTGDERKSIMLMLPELSKLSWYAKEYGYALDAQTQALLDKAEAQGFDVEKMKTQEQIMSEMADTMKEVAAIMKDLVDLFGYAFPDAAAKFKAAMELANGAGGGFQPAEPGEPGWNPKGKKGGNGDQPAEPDIKAASGFNGWVNGPTMILAGEAGRERVDIGGSNPGSMVNNWYITGTDPDGVAKAIVFAVKNNVYGAGDAIRKTRSN